MNIMLDLETLSSRPDACVVAIGAATFAHDGERQTFYTAVAPSSGHIDARTVQWWAKQSDAARAVLNDDAAMTLQDALFRFFDFCRSFREPKVWGNGASFDCVVLRQAYERSEIDAPWTYRNERCYRTLKNIWPVVAFEPSGVAHNALDDAISQARHAERIIAAMRAEALK